MIIAIDGNSGTGKSSIAESVSKILDWTCIKTGDIYRQIALITENQKNTNIGVDLIKSYLKYTIEGNCLRVFDYSSSEGIHNEHYARLAAIMASSKEIKEAIDNSIFAFIENRDVVIEGRNVASNLVSQKMIKVLLTADIQTRAFRRSAQLAGKEDYKSFKDSLIFRDNIVPCNSKNYDIVIDTSITSIEDTVSLILRQYHLQTHTRTLLELKHFLYSAYSKDTADISCLSDWNQDNPFRGHSAIASMVVYSCFGGLIKRGHFSTLDELHYWNEIEGRAYDLTIDQYQRDIGVAHDEHTISFEDLYVDNDIKERYELLLQRTIEIEKKYWHLNNKILQCKDCKNVHSPVFETVYLGKKCDLLIVGEAPSKNGWRLTGKAWINEEGKLVPTGRTLQRLLDGIGIDIFDISYLEAIKCYPEGGKITKEATANCKKYCYEQIVLLKPRLILSMGKYATEFLLGKVSKFSDIVGKIYTITIDQQEYKIIPIYHTSPASPLSYKGNVEIFDMIEKETGFNYLTTD